MKLTYDSGAFADNLDYALKLIDGADFAARRRGSEQAGKLRGLGISYYVEACGAGPGESATIQVADDGDVTVDRKGVVEGKSVSGRVDIGGRRIYKKKKTI